MLTEVLGKQQQKGNEGTAVGVQSRCDGGLDMVVVRLCRLLCIELNFLMNWLWKVKMVLGSVSQSVWLPSQQCQQLLGDV